MYWPIGTPRIYATTTAHASNRDGSLVISHDGLPPRSLVESSESANANDKDLNPEDPDAVPPTPATPFIRSVEHDTPKLGTANSGIPYLGASSPAVVPTGEPIIALKVSRTGHLFAVITASTLTIWQTKVRLAPLMRSLFSHLKAAYDGC